MKTKNRKLIAAAIFITAVSLTSTMRAADEEVQSESQAAIENFQKADSSLKPFFDSSAGYAVFPLLFCGIGSLFCGFASQRVTRWTGSIGLTRKLMASTAVTLP